MKIAIIGYGKQGKSAAEYWHKKDSDITVCDMNADLDLPEWVTPKLGPDHLNDLSDFDLIVRSPIIHPNQIAKANSPEILDKVTTTTNEFFKVCPTKNIIGITGTKGKGTTCTLTAKILETVGYKVHLGGNIGIDPLEMLKNNIQPEDWVVLELANFQLIDLQFSPKVAVCLMIVEEHLDWHKTIDEYINSKKSLFSHQNMEDIAIYNPNYAGSTTIADTSRGQKTTYFSCDTSNLAKCGATVQKNTIMFNNQKIMNTKEVGLVGPHNLENICAAATIAKLTVKSKNSVIAKTVASFMGLEHRIEYVCSKNDIKYYNDSFATTPAATIAALKSFNMSKILILGGSEKFASFDELAEAVILHNVKHIVTIGETGAKIAKTLQKKGFSNITTGPNNMQDIVKVSSTIAEPGDIVLLSTACASFGLFKNYQDRGEQFKIAVKRL